MRYGRAVKRLGTRLTTLLTWVLLLVGSLAARNAYADVRLIASPVLGPDLPPSEAWSSLLVRVDNREPKALRGNVEVTFEAGYGGHPTDTFVARAPYAVGPGDTAIVQIPVHSTGGFSLKIALLDETGKEVTKETMRSIALPEPALIDVAPTPRLGAFIRGARLPLRTSTASGKTNLIVTAPTFITPVDPILPERAAEYGAATVLVMPSDVLSRLTGPALDALTGWVLGGGTLATYIVRPEDLRSPTLAALVGGDVSDGGKASHLSGFGSRTIERDTSMGDSEALPPSPSTGPGRKPKATPGATVRAGDAIRDSLVAYVGGNLVRSDFGSSAAYGLGEVHILPFDLTQAPVLDDAWVQSRMVELVRYAWDRRTSVAFPPGSPIALDRPMVQPVRRQLDPNQRGRWAILVAAILLLGYSVFAGPFNFLLAAKAHKPLRALPILLGLSGATFAAILLLGVMAKGCSGESRRLAFVESSGGMSRGIIRRYRGFFTPSARTMSVTATSTDANLDINVESEARPTLVVDRGALRLQGLATLPWQTVVIREDATTTLGGGVSLTRVPGGDVRVTNRSARALRGLVVWVPGKGLYFHPELKDGASLLGSTGTRVKAASTGMGTTLSSSSFRKEVEGVSAGLAEAWGTLEYRSSAVAMTWWPDDVPVVLAQIDGGEGISRDAGMKVEQDRTLLRVVGYGGLP
ncbi:MAG: hypothetical protein U0165_09475 [Polyangiaceae bacterium]